jgi:hypothetical protein
MQHFWKNKQVFIICSGVFKIVNDGKLLTPKA